MLHIWIDLKKQIKKEKEETLKIFPNFKKTFDENKLITSKSSSKLVFRNTFANTALF
jgi:hypothetical protein